MSCSPAPRFVPLRDVEWSNRYMKPAASAVQAAATDPGGMLDRPGGHLGVQKIVPFARVQPHNPATAFAKSSCAPGA